MFIRGGPLKLSDSVVENVQGVGIRLRNVKVSQNVLDGVTVQGVSPNVDLIDDAGILNELLSTLTLKNSLVMDNTVTGIVNLAYYDLRIQNSVIINNRAVEIGGIFADGMEKSVYIQNSIITNNYGKTVAFIRKRKPRK